MQDNLAPRRRLLDTRELGELLGISRRTIERMKQSGLPYFLISRRSARFDEQEVLDYVRNHNHVVRFGKQKPKKKQEVATVVE